MKPKKEHVLTDDDMIRIEKQALAKLTHLSTVRLSVVNKQVELLFPIQFQEQSRQNQSAPEPPAKSGSKSGRKPSAVKGTEAIQTSKPSTDPVIENNQVVHKICGEIAEVLVVVNALLAEQGFTPFGLNVGGHTSVETNTSKELSFNRAKMVSLRIAEELAARDSSYNPTIEEIRATGCAQLPLGGRIVSQGYGSTQRLPGFDDGKNHKENRRVEIRLLVDQDDAAEAP
jgi:hypothetical protein